MEINDIQWQIIYGSILGDGYLRKYDRIRFGYMCFKHCLAQEEYVLYKHKMLQNISRTIRKDNRLDSRTKKVYYNISFTTKSNIIFDDLRNLWYPNNSKELYIPHLLQLNQLGLAIWFMDDGTKSGNELRLHTDCFSYSDQLILQEYFWSVWGVYFAIRTYNKKRYYLNSSGHHMRRFAAIIQPHIIPSMEYKLSNLPPARPFGRQTKIAHW